MTCTTCGATIADKALICYRCGNATTEAKFKPPAGGSIFERPRRRVPLWLWILVVAALIALGVFAYTQDLLMAQAAGRYAELQRAALAGRGPSVTVLEVLEPAWRESVEWGAWRGGSVLGVGVAAAAVAGPVSRRITGRPTGRGRRTPGNG
jgi:hypothetical protein